MEDHGRVYEIVLEGECMAFLASGSDLTWKDYVCATVCTLFEERSTFRCGVITANAKLFLQRTIAEIASEVKLPCNNSNLRIYSRTTPRYAAIVLWTLAVGEKRCCCCTRLSALVGGETSVWVATTQATTPGILCR